MTTPRHVDLRFPGGWAVLRTGSVLRVLDPDGRCLTELSGSRGAPLAVAGAWRGLVHDGVAPQWWALAFGRADDSAPLSVTFTGRRGPSTVPVRTAVRPAVADGLWVAEAAGLQFAVTCRQGVHQHVQRVAPVPGRWPVSGQPGGRAAG
jgi:hypothetical protein